MIILIWHAEGMVESLAVFPIVHSVELLMFVGLYLCCFLVSFGIVCWCCLVRVVPLSVGVVVINLSVLGVFVVFF